jgi:L-ascorbate metabolism protein UlaG (beta-lactamase superfamily)
MNAIRLLGASAMLALFSVLAVPSGASAAPAPDALPTNHGGDLTIQPIHHASLMLTWNDKHVLVDPAPLGRDATAAVTEFKALPSPDIILITHIHGDHFSVPVLQAVTGDHTTIIAPRNIYEKMPAELQAKAHVLANGEKTTVDMIPIDAVPAYNTTEARANFHPKGRDNGYVLTLGGKRIYIAGDTEESSTLAHLRNIYVAFIPMNLPYTQTVDAAAKWVKEFRPQYVYPYHYRNMDGSLADVQKFKELVGGASHVQLRDWYQTGG